MLQRTSSTRTSCLGRDRLPSGHSRKRVNLRFLGLDFFDDRFVLLTRDWQFAHGTYLVRQLVTVRLAANV